MPAISKDALRDLFLAPTNDYRHLMMLHEFRGWRHTPCDSGGGPLQNRDELATKDVIKSRLTKLIDWGFGGIVANVGHENYLESEEQWGIFLVGVEAARELGMRIWIYDEHGYPSGAAGGIVLRDHPEYEAQGLVQTVLNCPAGDVEIAPPSGWLYAVRAEMVSETGEVMDITSAVDDTGALRIRADGAHTIRRYDARRAFEGTHANRNVFRHRRYINVLQQEAVDYFYAVTDQRYLDRLGERASAIEAVFTDEPSYMAAYFPPIPELYWGKIQAQDEPAETFDQLPMIAWERTLPESFAARWGYDLLPEISRLYEGSASRDLQVRHDFYQHQSEIYARVFFQSQQERLAPHGIEFSGHVLAEESIVHHVACEGNVMMDLKAMDLPGIDMLNSIGEEILDSIRLLTCKYGSSAAHVTGREQTMCEASDFEQRSVGGDTTPEQRRGALAVQMALGITTFTSYYPWHETNPEERRRVLDFCARLATVVRHGTHVADIAVLYPARTAWAHYKPTREVLSPALMDEPLRSMDSNLQRIAREIIRRGMDFDFIDTRDLIDSRVEDGKLRVGAESYSTLVIPPGAVMCPKDLEAVERFIASGGQALAFAPLSEVALAESASPPNGTDAGPGRSAAEAVAKLAEEAPARMRLISLDEDWLRLAAIAAASDVAVEFEGTHLVARRSVFENRDLVLVANGCRKGARAQVSFANTTGIELWDPWEGTTTPLLPPAHSSRSSHRSAEVAIPAYSAIVIVSTRSET
jgi:hypothetical protein